MREQSRTKPKLSAESPTTIASISASIRVLLHLPQVSLPRHKKSVKKLGRTK
jgi:hypothetical protein